MIELFNQWIEQCGEHAVSAIDLAVRKPHEFQAYCAQDNRSFVTISKDDIRFNFVALWCVTEQISGIESSPSFLRIFLENLLENHAIFKFARQNFDIYCLNFSILNKLIESGQIGGLALGIQYVVRKYMGSIVEICVLSESGDYSTGTGFLLDNPDSICSVATCKHVMFDKLGQLRPIVHLKASGTFLRPKQVMSFNRIDVSIIDLCDQISAPGFKLVPGNLLDEVTTAGFPKIMLRVASPLLFHRGHINGWTGDRKTVGTAGIISAGTAPGCSGGPVINSYGGVVGMVDQRIETKFEDEESKYNAMIPSELIISEEELAQISDPISVS